MAKRWRVKEKESGNWWIGEVVEDWCFYVDSLLLINGSAEMIVRGIIRIVWVENVETGAAAAIYEV